MSVHTSTSAQACAHAETHPGVSTHGEGQEVFPDCFICPDVSGRCEQKLQDPAPLRFQTDSHRGENMVRFRSKYLVVAIETEALAHNPPFSSYRDWDLDPHFKSSQSEAQMWTKMT